MFPYPTILCIKCECVINSNFITLNKLANLGASVTSYHHPVTEKWTVNLVIGIEDYGFSDKKSDYALLGLNQFFYRLFTQDPH